MYCTRANFEGQRKFMFDRSIIVFPFKSCQNKRLRRDKKRKYPAGDLDTTGKDRRKKPGNWRIFGLVQR